MALITRRYIHEVSKDGALYFLLNSLIGAYNRRTDVLAKGTGNDNSQVLQAINNLNRKVDTMSSNIDRIEKEAADMAENVALVRTALDGLNTTITDLRGLVADLQAQVAQGQLDQARLDAAAATLEKADEDIDALVLPAPPPAAPVEG